MAPLNNTMNPTSDLRSAQWRGVFFDGPEADTNHDGDEIPVWFVYVGNEEAEPLHTVYTCFSFDFAQDLARRMSEDRHLELVQDATPA